MTEQPSKYNMENVPSQSRQLEIQEAIEKAIQPQPPSEFESESGESFNPSILNEPIETSLSGRQSIEEYRKLLQLRLQLQPCFEAILNHARMIEYLLNSMRELDLDDREKCGIEFLAKESAIKIQELVYEHLEVKLAVRLRDDV